WPTAARWRRWDSRHRRRCSWSSPTNPRSSAPYSRGTMAANPREATVPLPSREPLAVQPFPEWTYEDAAKAVRELLPEDYEERKDYAHDRHWRNGDGFVGPMPSPDDPAVLQKQ